MKIFGYFIYFHIFALLKEKETNSNLNPYEN